jgi:hypothetical protein
MSEKVPTFRTAAELPDVLAGRNLALFIDGKRIETKAVYHRGDDNVYTVLFDVPYALADGTFADKATADAWGGWRVNDMAWVYPIRPGETEAKSGRMGMVRIADIVPPKNATASNGVTVRVTALMPVYDGSSSEPIIAQNATGTIPLEWLKVIGELYNHA